MPQPGSLFAVKRLVVLALLVASRAVAAPAEYSDGEKLYKAARYLDAAEKFRAAYEAEPDPNFLLDAAQAYRFGEDCAKSAEYYQKYLDKVPDAPKIKELIAEQAACAKQQAAAHPVVVVAPIDPQRPPQPSHTRLYIGIATALAGFAAAGFGWYEDSKLDAIATRRSAAVAHCTMASICTAGEYNSTAQPYDDLALHKQINGIVGYSLGGLGVAAAIYLIVMDLTPEHGAIKASASGAMAFGTWAF